MTSIERHLLNHGGWVPVAELCRLFDLDERDLRSRDEKPGLCSQYAISGNAGLKHIRNATRAEYERCQSRLRLCATGYFIRSRSLEDAWNEIHGPMQQADLPLT